MCIGKLFLISTRNDRNGEHREVSTSEGYLLKFSPECIAHLYVRWTNIHFAHDVVVCGNWYHNSCTYTLMCLLQTDHTGHLPFWLFSWLGAEYDARRESASQNVREPRQ